MKWVENHLDSSARRAEVSRLKSGWLVVTSNMPRVNTEPNNAEGFHYHPGCWDGLQIHG